MWWLRGGGAVGCSHGDSARRHAEAKGNDRVGGGASSAKQQRWLLTNWVLTKTGRDGGMTMTGMWHRATQLVAVAWHAAVDQPVARQGHSSL